MKSLQVIKALNGREEYVLLPVNIYRALHHVIDKKLTEVKVSKQEDYEPFILEDYVDNPVAIARIKANLTQEVLAEALGVSQAYISKLESQETVTPKMLQKVVVVIEKLR